MKIVCMKVGVGYKSEFVNQMLHQIEKTNKIDDFICWTDNPRGLDSNVTVRNFKPKFNERLWWNKAMLFEPGLFESDTIYLDLDCFVHGDLSCFISAGQILRTTWFSEEINHYIFHCNVNSSVMYLKDDNFKTLYVEFTRLTERLYKSFYGLDSWIYRRHRPNVKFFEDGLAYSYKYGSTFPNDLLPYTTRDNHVVCCFDDVDDKYETLHKFWEK